MPVKVNPIVLCATERESVVEIISRFWSRAVKHPILNGWPSGCWVWQSNQKIAQFKYGGRDVLAPRFAYLISKGDPGPLHVLHRCDNPKCVNPEHLFLGTHQDNMRDRNEKGRARGGQGEMVCTSKLSEKQVIQMRKEYIPRKMSYQKLADKYGMTVDNVQKIIRRIYWRHVP